MKTLFSPRIEPIFGYHRGHCMRAKFIILVERDEKAFVAVEHLSFVELKLLNVNDFKPANEPN
jgi:hypothetical protein